MKGSTSQADLHQPERARAAPLQARLLEDCARNFRIEYTLPTLLTRQLIERAGATRIVVNNFSHHVQGAFDHIVGSFGASPSIRAEGSIGENSLVVTFGSLDRRANPEAVVQFEVGLNAALAEHHERVDSA